MEDRKKLLQALITDGSTQIDQAVALLWLYAVKQEYEERTAKELIQDFVDENFSKPNLSRFSRKLRKDKRTIRGKSKDSFKINPKFFTELTTVYAPIVSYVQTQASSSIIPLNFVDGKKIYLGQLVKQINGCYDNGFYDASTVILRRLLESLIIEAYINCGRTQSIRNGTVFMYLDDLIRVITSDSLVVLGRNSSKTMRIIKDIGDTAAHDRNYITPKEDIDDNMQKIRQLIQEMINISGV